MLHTTLRCMRSRLPAAPRRTAAALGALCLSWLVGCANQPTPAPVAPTTTPLPDIAIEPNAHFDTETLYALLTAELALTRERYELGLENYVQQARRTGDVNIAARAAQVARILNRHPEALEMAELWHAKDPGSREARFILVAEYIYSGEYDLAFSQAKRLLEAGHSGGFEDIAIEASQENSEGLEALSVRFGDLLALYPNNIELLIGQSILLQALAQPDAALGLAEQATALEPENTRALYQQYRVLHQLGRDEEALAIYARLVKSQPDNFRIRSRYAHMLIQTDIREALYQYQVLHAQAPQNEDVLLNLALIQLDQKQYSEAEYNFEILVERGEHLDIAHFSLGDIAEYRNQPGTALNHYLTVEGGPRFVDAVSRAADIINVQEGFENALVFIASRRENAQPQDRESLYLIEADTLASHGYDARALAIYDLGLAEFPDSVKLLYSRAMHYARTRDTEAAVHDLEKVLALVPENAATLNALGYTLLDQTDRIDEAEVYIRRAHELNPEDPAILDSLGWLEYRRGNTTRAITLLRSALDKLFDAEIAAHLGEAYWTTGERRKARSVWRKALEASPEDPLILNTLERLNVELN